MERDALTAGESRTSRRAGVDGIEPERRHQLAGRQLGGPESDFVIVEWTDSGESEREWIAPLHVHHADDEAWYVLDCVLRFRIGEDNCEAGPDAAIFAPKATPHAYGMRSVVSLRATCLS